MGAPASCFFPAGQSDLFFKSLRGAAICGVLRVETMRDNPVEKKEHTYENIIDRSDLRHGPHGH